MIDPASALAAQYPRGATAAAGTAPAAAGRCCLSIGGSAQPTMAVLPC